MTISEPLIPEGSPARAAEPPYDTPVEALLAAVIERLKAELVQQVTIDFFPDDPDHYDFEGYDAAALVLYQGSSYDQAGQLGAQGLAETVRLSIALLVRSLRGLSGAYGLIHAIRLALHGQRLAGAVALRPVDVALESQSDQVFQYRLGFETRLVAVPGRAVVPGVAVPRSNINRM